MSTRNLHTCSIPFVATLMLGVGGLTAAPLFTPLGHYGSGDFSQATSVSDDGRFVGGHATGVIGGFSPIIWDGTEANFLTLPPGFDGGAYVNALSGDGLSAVAIGLGSTGFQGIRWDATGTPFTLPTNPMTFSSFNAINYDGTVAAGFTNQTFGGLSDAVIWTASGGIQNIGTLPGWTGEASFTGMNNDGSRLVGYATDTMRRAVTWDSVEGFKILETVPGGSGAGIAIDIAGDGSTVVGAVQVSNLNRPVFWDADNQAHLIDLRDGYAVGEANGVSAGGVIVIGNWRETEFSDELGSLAFVWDEVNGVRALQDMLTNEYGVDLMGWTLNTVTDITPDGLTFVGSGLNAAGQLEAYKVTVPAPAGLFVLGSVGLLSSRRRSRSGV